MEGGKGSDGGGWGEVEGDQTLHVIKKEEIDMEKHIYTKAADLHRIFFKKVSRLLLLTLPRGNALYSPEKAMIVK